MIVAIASIALVVALAAIAMARRQQRQIAQLTEMYWQLKYDHGELKASVTPPRDEPPPAPAAFVPLSSVKRSQP